MLAFCKGKKVRLLTRNGNDWTHRFGFIVKALESLPIEQAILDGEIVSLDVRGISNFQQLQNQLKRGDEKSLAYYLFDMPHFSGYDLTSVPLVERKALVERLLAARPARDDETLRYSDHILGDGTMVLREACRGGLEGIVSKRTDSTYAQARSPAWLKTKCTKRQEFVIGGFTQPTGTRVAFGALLGYYNGAGGLIYAGKVGTGFTHQSLRDLHHELQRRKINKPPFSKPPTGAEARGVTWVKPELMGEVEFTEWTADGQLRHPSFQGLREDKPPQSIVREEVQTMPAKKSSVAVKKTTRAKSASKAAEATVAGVRISHPERVVYPDVGVTKLDLARYYESVADWILPYVEGRPLTLVRCPAGQAGQCFFQKHLHDAELPSVHTIMIKEKKETDEYLVVNDVAGLVELVQMDVMEFHPWPAREDNVERPDQLIFDLDPGKGVEWTAVVQGARNVRDCLEALGLQSFLRTSGGKGLHVVAPLARRNSWDELKEFARRVAETIVAVAPDRYVANMSKAKRGGKIFVDYLRNQRGATAVASYSTRARPGAAVAAPLAWEELTARIKPDRYRVKNIHKRLATLDADPWEKFFTLRQSITAKMRELVQS